MISWEIRFTFATNYIISTCFDDAPESQSSSPLPVRRMSLYCRCCCCCCWSSVIYRRRHNRKSCCSRMMKNFYSMNFFFICDVIPPTTPTCLRVYREEVGRLIPVSRSVIAVRNGTELFSTSRRFHCIVDKSSARDRRATCGPWLSLVKLVIIAVCREY